MSLPIVTRSASDFTEMLVLRRVKAIYGSTGRTMFKLAAKQLNWVQWRLHERGVWGFTSTLDGQTYVGGYAVFLKLSCKVKGPVEINYIQLMTHIIMQYENVIMTNLGDPADNLSKKMAVTGLPPLQYPA
jgi:hypothetical protein